MSEGLKRKVSPDWLLTESMAVRMAFWRPGSFMLYGNSGTDAANAATAGEEEEEEEESPDDL